MQKINLKDFFSEKAQTKYCCAKNAIALSKENPEKLYPEFNFFLQFLLSENHVLKWTAIIIIGNLARVDDKNKIDKIIPVFFSFLEDKNMITACNAMKALVNIAKKKMRYREKIFCP